jgi:predicted alpha/beta hydrolase
VEANEFVFQAEDGRLLAGTAWEPAHIDGAVVVASATGVPRRIYRGLAAHLAEADLAVLTFDYRGIGGSRDRPLRNDRATLEEWGRLDLEAALGWMRQHHPGVPLLLVGHSAGGQLIGLAPSGRHLTAALTVGAQMGWSGNWPWPSRALMWGFWNLVIPALVRVVGFLPMRAVGQGEDLPSGVARQWARWGRRRNYLFDDLGPEVRQAYAALSFPLRALHIADDGYAPRRGVEQLASFYGGGRNEVLTLEPRALGVQRIGHFGWVRPTFRETIWTPIRGWLVERAQLSAGPAGSRPPMPSVSGRRPASRPGAFAPALPRPNPRPGFGEPDPTPH